MKTTSTINLQQRLISTLLLTVILILNSCTPESSENGLRTKTNLNANWLYLENNTPNIDEALKMEEWSAIDLPHSWNSLDATDTEPGYRRDASWYKKTLDIPQIIEGQTYQLYFEGVNITSDVYVNSKNVGGHIGGYIGFTTDITEAIKKGENDILIRVDNGYNREVIPSQKSDFFIFGGITRDVWLVTLPKQHLNDLRITTPNVSETKASLAATISINGSADSPTQKVKATLTDNEGNTVVEELFDITNKTSEIAFNTIPNPKLWDTENPNLYALTVALIDGDAVLDVVTERFGFRWFEFKEYGAFFLNGKRVLLRGTHRHEEHAGVGAAMTNEQHRRDMELIKEMGANFVRLAHYPQDPEIYKACDELGLLVWDELPWCRGGLGNDTWKTNTKNMLTEIIDQNYNHPSIILWSLGNEIYWLPDFENGDDRDKINIFLKELNALAHQLDPTRKTAIRKYYEGADIVDVFSPSIWSGWYSGSYKSYQKAIDLYKKEYPHFLHTEYGGSSHVGRHTENPITGEGVIKADGWEEAIVQTKVANIAQIGDWSENYIVDLFDWHLRITENDSTFVGNAQWAFKDFGTPLRPENDIPYMNQKGLVDRNGKPKDAFYVFKSYWANEPFTYIESHTWTERQGPKGLARHISVYSNCDLVDLSLNGQNLGSKQRNTNDFPAAGLNWTVNFEEGENILVSVGKTPDGTKVTDTLTVHYRFSKNDKPKELTLASKKLANGNFLVTALALDAKGLRCLDYEEQVYFQCLSGGTTLKSQGTPTGSESIAMANGKASIEVIPYENAQTITITVLNQSFKGTFLTIDNEN